VCIYFLLTLPIPGKRGRTDCKGEWILIDISTGECVAMFVKAADRVPFCTHHFRREKWNFFPQFRKNEIEILIM
jgi:hypothetical protein